MTIAPYFTSPEPHSTHPHSNVPVTGVGEPRTNVSICIANHGYELASVFCDENGHFSATLKFQGPETIAITAQCRLANSASSWGPSMTINLS